MRRSMTQATFRVFLLAMATLLALALASPTSSRSGRTTQCGPQSTQSGSSSTDIAISTASVLLPPDPNVSFEVDAINGCFKWKEVRESQLILIDELESCGRRIKVSVSPDYKTASAPAKAGAPAERYSTLLIAEDIATQRVLRCEVFIDTITRIEILTTARSLSRDDIQELQVQAFDAQGNLFSSVEGLEFQWSLQPETASDAGKVIMKRMPFKDSGYEASTRLLEFEAAGKESGTILLQAMEVGRVKVSATLVEAPSVPSHTVIMSVVEPLELVPAKTLYVSPFTLFTYKLMTYQRRQRTQIDMPNPQYLWSSTSEGIATVDSTGRISTANKLGYTTIRVQHSSMDSSVTTGGIHVVQPARLSFRLRPASYVSEINVNTRYMVQEVTYLLEVDVYDAANNRMDQFDGCLDFDLAVDSSSIKILKRMSSNSWTVVGSKLGTSFVTVTLTRVGHQSLGNALPEGKISTQQSVDVTERVRLDRETLVLPVGHTFQLVATGGTGSYDWSSTDNSVMAINNAGLTTVVLQVAPVSPQAASIFVSDERDPIFNRASLQAFVATPNGVSFSPSVREAELGTQLILPVSMSFNSSLSFDNCSAIPMTFNSTIADIFSHAGTPANCPSGLAGCSCVEVVANKEGQTRFSVAVVDTQLSAITPIAAFRPLVVSPERVLVALESSLDVTVSGGPQPWQYQTVNTPVLSLQNKDAVSIVPVYPTSVEEPSGASWTFRLTCHSLGSQQITVRVSNPTSTTNPQPYVATRTVSFDCAEPKHVFVTPVIAAKVGDEALAPGVLQAHSVEGQTACSEPDSPAKLRELHVLLASISSGEKPVDPFTVLPSRYKLRNNRLVLFQVALLDSAGRVFDNFSSLAIDWTTANASLISLTATSNLSQSKTHRLARLADKDGTSSLRVAVTGYDTASLTGVAAATSRPAWSQPVAKSFDISLVPNVRVIPPKISIYNHPDNKVRLFSLGGSGYVSIQMNDSSVADVTHVLGSGEISVAPTTNGVVKISIVDLCLAGSDPATAMVHVSNVASIRIKSRDMVKIGDQMPFHVDLLDSFGATFEAAQLKWIEPKIHVDGTALEVAKINATNQYIASGRHVGVSTISVSAFDPRTDATVSSAPLQVHVYPPFQVSPSKLELMPGAQFQLAVSGGPPFRSEITFDVSDEAVATVTKDGFVTAQGLVSSGRTTIQVSIWSRVAGSDSSEKPQRAGSATVEVEVHHLKGIRIHASSSRLLLGEETALRVEGIDGETPFAWGGLDVTFKWEVVNPDVVALAPIFENSNVSLDEEHGFTVRIRGSKPGSTRVSVRVTAGPTSLIGKSASIYIDIIPPLTLSGPARRWESSSRDLLLLAPGAAYALVSNVAKNVKYSVVSDVPCGQSTTDEAPIVRLEERSSTNSLIIHSIGLAGQTIVHAKDRTDGQIALVKVAVKPVYHVELRPRYQQSLQSGSTTPSILQAQATPFKFPVGNTVEFELVLRDELGQPFDGFVGQLNAASVQFESVVNRPDLVSVEIVRSTNGTTQETDVAEGQPGAVVVRVRGLRPGRATFLIRLAQPSTIASTSTPNANLHYYQLIRVANAILPMRPVIHVGGSVAFNTTFPRDRSYKKVWSSSNEPVLTVDPETGVAQAVAAGSANVYHNSSVYTVTQARVAPVASIETNTADCVSALANPTGQPGQQMSCVVSVKCKDADGNVFLDVDDSVGNKIIRHNIPIHCISSHPDVFSTQASSIAVGDGQSTPACILTWTNRISLQVTAIKLNIRVGQKQSASFVSDDVSIPLVGHSIANHVRFSIKGSPIAQLSASQPSVKYSVSTTRDLIVKVRDSKDSQRVLVKELPESNPGHRLYEVAVSGSSPLTEPAVIDFSDPVSFQSETVSILFSGDGMNAEEKARQLKEREEQLLHEQTKSKTSESEQRRVPAPETNIDFGLVVLGIILLAGACIGAYIMVWNKKVAAAQLPKPPGSAFKTPSAAMPSRTPASMRFSNDAASPYSSIHKPRDAFPPSSPAPHSPYKVGAGNTGLYK